MLLDAAGVIVLPDAELLARTFGRIGAAIDPRAVIRAHYRAVASLGPGPGRTAYPHALVGALGIEPARREAAAAAFDELNDRRRSGVIVWGEPAPGARAVIERLMRGGVDVAVVSNSDGLAAQNLRDAGICQVGPGRGASVSAVIDSAIVGAAKPDPRIFHAALEAVGARPEEAVHVGDQLHADVEGAAAAGIEPIHLDPYRSCRATGHRHVRSLAGLWHHAAAR